MATFRLLRTVVLLSALASSRSDDWSITTLAVSVRNAYACSVHDYGGTQGYVAAVVLWETLLGPFGVDLYSLSQDDLTARHLVGPSSAGYQDGQAKFVRFNSPLDVTFSKDGSWLAMADTNNHAIRRIDAETGAVTTIAGCPRNGNCLGSQDGPATLASFYSPTAVAIDPQDLFVFVADTNNNMIRQIDLTTKVVTTVTGATKPGYADGLLAASQFYNPTGIAVHPDFTNENKVVVVADTQNHAIRMIDLFQGKVSTVAGSGCSSSGCIAGFEDGTLITSKLSRPKRIKFNPVHVNLMIFIDKGNNRLRMIDMSSGRILTAPGSSSNPFDIPEGLAYDTRGNPLMISDVGDSQLKLYVYSTCGNGKTEGREGCDDGNLQGADGCSSSCSVERGFTCSNTCREFCKVPAPSLCSPICGDGLVVGSETCDDGNHANGDGCSDICTIEAGFSCMITSRNVSSCSTICGDGLVKGKEQCDDGNTRNGDGCSANCTLETAGGGGESSQSSQISGAWFYVQGNISVRSSNGKIEYGAAQVSIFQTATADAIGSSFRVEDVVIVAVWFQGEIQGQRRVDSSSRPVTVRANDSVLQILFRLMASSSTETLTIARKLSDWLQTGRSSTDLQARGWPVTVGPSGYPLVVRSSNGETVATFPLSSEVWKPQPSKTAISKTFVVILSSSSVLLFAFVLVGLIYRSAVRRRKSMRQNQASLEESRRVIRAALDLQRVYRGHLDRMRVKRKQRGEVEISLEDLLVSHSEGLEAPAAVQQSDEELYDLSQDMQSKKPGQDMILVGNAQPIARILPPPSRGSKKTYSAAARNEPGNRARPKLPPLDASRFPPRLAQALKAKNLARLGEAEQVQGSRGASSSPDAPPPPPLSKKPSNLPRRNPSRASSTGNSTVSER